jgi:hypothetical protein
MTTPQVWVSCHPIERLWTFDSGTEIKQVLQTISNDLRVDTKCMHLVQNDSPSEINDQHLTEHARLIIMVVNCNDHPEQKQS